MIRIHYPNDLLRIQKVLLDNGIYADIPECYKLWENYSLSIYSRWLTLPTSDELLWDALQRILNETPIQDTL